MTGQVTRYPQSLPEWTRVQWASEAVEALWRPRLARIQAAWQAVERATVGELREACRQTVTSEELPALTTLAAAYGLVCQILRRVAPAPHYRTSAAPAPAPGAPAAYDVAITTRAAALAWQRAWAAQDDMTLGLLLGYPRCCLEAYRARWMQAGWRDLTWLQAVETTGAQEFGPHMVSLVASATPSRAAHVVEANLLWRWLGVRWVPHLPCTWNCAATRRLGQRWRGRVYAVDAEAGAWIDDLLEGPAQWSAWHGIAEIETPLCRVSAWTDATAERIVVRWPGRRQPEGSQRAESDGTWSHNGFRSRAAMDQGHAVVLAALAEAPEGPVLDLGAGNGYLVARSGRPGVGVEQDADRVAHGAARGWPVQLGRVQRPETWPDAQWAVVLIGEPRLHELAPSELGTVASAIAERAQGVISYRYDPPASASWRPAAAWRADLAGLVREAR